MTTTATTTPSNNDVSDPVTEQTTLSTDCDLGSSLSEEKKGGEQDASSEAASLVVADAVGKSAPTPLYTSQSVLSSEGVGVFPTATTDSGEHSNKNDDVVGEAKDSTNNASPAPLRSRFSHWRQKANETLFVINPSFSAPDSPVRSTATNNSFGFGGSWKLPRRTSSTDPPPMATGEKASTQQETKRTNSTINDTNGGTTSQQPQTTATEVDGDDDNKSSEQKNASVAEQSKRKQSVENKEERSPSETKTGVTETASTLAVPTQSSTPIRRAVSDNGPTTTSAAISPNHDSFEEDSSSYCSSSSDFVSSDSGDDGKNGATTSDGNAADHSGCSVGRGGVASRVAALPGLQWAAASVADSVPVTNFFRGRYGGTTNRGSGASRKSSSNEQQQRRNSSEISNQNDAEAQNLSTPVPRGKTDSAPFQSSPPPLSSPPATPTSQTKRILSNSRVASHMQALMERLEPDEYVMLLGRGPLGVNLKQTYLRHQGVYVDFLVQGGAAHLSNLVKVGDALRAVGEVSVQQGTIVTVPASIGKAKRPVHLILSTGANVPHKNINYLDVAMAMTRFLQKHELQGCSTEKQKILEEKFSDASCVESNGGEETRAPTPVAQRNNDDETGDVDASVAGKETIAMPPIFLVDIPICDSVDAFVNPVPPSDEVREAYCSEIIMRGDELFDVDALCQAAGKYLNFRAALRNAFLMCCVDARRFPFLARHLSLQEDLQRNKTRHHQQQPASKSTNVGVSAPNAMLMMYMEMINFSDLYGVTPAHRRREIASKIAHKFFLPCMVGMELVPPLFDFHQLVSSQSLRQLEARLKDVNTEVSRDIFFDFQLAVVDTLSGRPFISFLGTAECGRMKAYLRNTAPLVNTPLDQALNNLRLLSPGNPENSSKVTNSRNYFVYVLLYLLCLTDKEGAGENDMIQGNDSGFRVENAANEIFAAICIKTRVLPLLSKAAEQNNEESEGISGKILSALEQLWEFFLAAGVGETNEVEEHCNIFRETIETVGCDGKLDKSNACLVVKRLVDDGIANKMSLLAEELIYDYAVRIHSRFRGHKVHEWMCQELTKNPSNKGQDADTLKESENNDPKSSAMSISANNGNAVSVPTLPVDCIKRLLRKADLPTGVSSHKPSRLAKQLFESDLVQNDVDGQKESLQDSNADYAVIFGTAFGEDELDVGNFAIAHQDNNNMRRYACQSVQLEGTDDDGVPSDFVVPTTLESYATPSSPSKMARSKPFNSFLPSQRAGGWLSSDGWEISLTNFLVPRADAAEDGEETSLYGVSLVFRKVKDQLMPEGVHKASLQQKHAPAEIAKSADGTVQEEETTFSEGAASLRSESRMEKMQTGPVFNQRLSERKWCDRIALENEEGTLKQNAAVTLGIALVSKRNTIHAMRETLDMLLEDYLKNSREEGSANKMMVHCAEPLLNILGNFYHADVETNALRGVLEPYLRQSSKAWLERPAFSQKYEFERAAGEQLLQSLSPIPLALMFATALLEQKIVLSSTRRSLLLSATTALQTLLRPLKWCHLVVPVVPTALAADLLQYPAPYILGLPTEPEVIDLIRDLPQDVTLVDLDVGRVILASSFAQDSELYGRARHQQHEGNSANIVMANRRAVRSQVLYFAQSLGYVFGALLDPGTWLCDRPSLSSRSIVPSAKLHSFDRLQVFCQNVIGELLAGTTSCCYWVEESLTPNEKTTKNSASLSNPTILFDEDRFFQIKSLRAKKGYQPLFLPRKNNCSRLALSPDDFDLVLELFLRGQSMNAYVGSRECEEMLFSL